MRRPLAVLLVPVLLALAGCPAPESDPCTPANLKSSARDLMRSYYLFPDLMAAVDPDDPAYPTVDAYLDAMTRPAQDAGKDRGWTYATSFTESMQRLEEGTSVGFGIGWLLRTDGAAVTHVLVTEVFPGSPAAGAGFARGDEILAIGESEAALVDVPGQLPADQVNAWVWSAVGPSTAGLSRAFRALTLAGATEVRSMTKATYGLDPVPAGDGGWRIVDRTAQGLPPAGYVGLRTFVRTANEPLKTVFTAFKEAGVTDVVVDLRYNGGGYVSTADLLANLLAGDRATSDVEFVAEYNAAHAYLNDTTYFAPGCDRSGQTVTCGDAVGAPGVPFRIAFITTHGSASASELVVNALEAWHHGDTAIVGATTYGKPVGQQGWGLQQCDLIVWLVSFRLVNAEGDGDYFAGLPNANFSGAFCPATDDLTHAQGDPAEAMTAAALTFLSTGACPPQQQPAAKLWSSPAARSAPAVPDTYPRAPRPDGPQRDFPGLL